jgi:hypothetical protein
MPVNTPVITKRAICKRKEENNYRRDVWASRDIQA